MFVNLLCALQLNYFIMSVHVYNFVHNALPYGDIHENTYSVGAY